MQGKVQKREELELWEVAASNRPRRRTGQSGRTQSGSRSDQIDYTLTESRASRQRSRAQTGNRTSQQRSRTQTESRASGQRSRAQTGYTGRNTAQMYRMPQSRSAMFNRKQAALMQKRRRAKRRRAYGYRLLAAVMLAVCFVLFFLLTGMVYQTVNEWKRQEKIPVTKVSVENREVPETKKGQPAITVDLLEINDYSRPGTKLDQIDNIFVHYTANPKTSARQNRSYFSNLAQTHERSASAHYIIGYDGEIIQCIPLEEQAYAVMTRNEDSISIECCYLEEDGEFTQETYDSLVQLLAWLIKEYHLESEDILRHYDCGGKKCPLYYVEHEDAWDKLLRDVKKLAEE